MKLYVLKLAYMKMFVKSYSASRLVISGLSCHDRIQVKSGRNA